MESLGRLDELIAQLQAQRDVLKNRINELETAVPTFDEGISPALAVDGKAYAARRTMADAATELIALVSGAQGILTLPSHNHWTSLHVIVEFGLTTAIDPDSHDGKTFEELAELTSPPLDVDTVKRVMRHAMTLHIFKESPLGTVCHNAASRYLARTPEMRMYISSVMNVMWPAACQVSHALKKWGAPIEPNQSGFQLALGTDLTVFEHMGQNPQKAREFAGAMRWFTSGPGWEVTHLVDGYPWAEIEANGKAVDIGGSHGETALAVTQQYPTVEFVVQDLERVVTEGKRMLPSNISNVTFMAHDFFTEQPIKGADIYLMRMILHDWSDGLAAKILSAIVPAMEKHSRLVIMEHIIPEPGTVPINVEYMTRGFDIAMLEFQNGRERDMKDWEKLFALVGPRLRITRTFLPQASFMGLIEARIVE